ncbi:MAG: hypothetical protein KDD82_06510 [Planctomycetes bacterium]|nr:hypothetical protein [Planctomycetota bacterium]
MKLKGTIERVDLGMGGWALVTDDGRRFALMGKGLSPGPAEVEGEVVTDAAGFGMTGAPAFKVSQVSPQS